MEKLNEIYVGVKVKYTTLEDIAEPDIENDKDKFYEKVWTSQLYSN